MLSNVVVYLVVREENGYIRVCGCILLESSVETVLYNLVVLLTLSLIDDSPVGEVVVWSICVKWGDVFIPLVGVRKEWWVAACDVVALINVCFHCGFCDAEGALSAIKCFFQGSCLYMNLLARCSVGWNMVFFVPPLISLPPPIASPGCDDYM